ncbi:unnamed protein product [Caenorhabditis sp. 36 PRJEB53466]|nr:unnamed protein product [Caenorhabditis sp. 36 PRJEB53466]
MVDYGVGYDYGSVMHYDQLAFSSNGGNTISTLDPNYQATIGQRVAPSFADVKRINLAYCNSTCSDKLDCQFGGYINPNDCNNCKCPPGFGGQLCNVSATSSSGCGTGNLEATSTVQSISASGALTCNYIITAPVGAKVYFQMTGATFSRSSPCSSNYLEINYLTDFTLAGARFCTSFPTISVSETNTLVVIYKGVHLLNIFSHDFWNVYNFYNNNHYNSTTSFYYIYFNDKNKHSCPNHYNNKENHCYYHNCNYNYSPNHHDHIHI